MIETSGYARRAGVFIAVNALVAAIAIIAALCTGSVETSPAQAMAALFQGGQDTMARVVIDLRLPRVASAFIVGGMLALAGALMQVMLRNPLADPYVLGVSGGASVFALLAIAAGLGMASVQAAAFGGALLSILLVFALARAGGEWNPLRVLLIGVVIAAGWGAAVGFLLSVSPATQVHGMLFWLMGDLGHAQYSHWAALVLVGAFLASMALAPALNLMLQGELQAAALGVPVRHLRHALYFLASLLTATAVMQAGSIGFIGLIVPHLCRLLVGSNHRVLLPGAMLMGGSLLVLADMLARTVLAPQQLPAGILTAAMGVPLFLFLVHTTTLRQRA